MKGLTDKEKKRVNELINIITDPRLSHTSEMVKELHSLLKKAFDSAEKLSEVLEVASLRVIAKEAEKKFKLEEFKKSPLEMKLDSLLEKAEKLEQFMAKTFTAEQRAEQELAFEEFYSKYIKTHGKSL